MNIQKAFLLTLIIAIVTLGLTLTGCEKKFSETPVPQIDPQTAEDMARDAQETAKDMAADADNATEDRQKTVEDATK